MTQTCNAGSLLAGHMLPVSIVDCCDPQANPTTAGSLPGPEQTLNRSITAACIISEEAVEWCFHSPPLMGQKLSLNSADQQ